MKTLDMLQNMHAENRADHAELVKKVDSGFTTMNSIFLAHAREDDTRFNEVKLTLQPLVELHKGIVWAKRSFYGAGFLALLAEVMHIAFTRAGR
jgi:hypothetical protein